MRVSRLHLDNWSVVCFLGPYGIVDTAEDCNEPCYEYGPVHGLRRDGSETRPEAEKQHKCEVYAGKSIVGDA